MNISVAIPSYRRSKVKTLEYMPDAKVYVCETEAKEYEDMNYHINLVTMPKGIQGNIARVRNYIIKEELKVSDAVCVVDDDMDYIGYFEEIHQTTHRPDQFFPRKTYPTLSGLWVLYVGVKCEHRQTVLSRIHSVQHSFFCRRTIHCNFEGQQLLVRRRDPSERRLRHDHSTDQQEQRDFEIKQISLSSETESTDRGVCVISQYR